MGKTFSRIPKLFSSGSKEPCGPECNGPACTLPPGHIPPTETTHSLATPRSPLHRTKRPASPSSTPPEEQLAKRLRGDFQYLNFAFLKNNSTISFIQESKVMFIMKGPPGSGKSFISQEIQKVYQDTAVCSADHYYIHEGMYKFDKEIAKDAYEYCKQQAASAARQNTHVIVIDNRCMQNWEMEFYLKLARAHKYIPVVVEPQTPWAMVLRELAVKHGHSKPGKMIPNKVKSYVPVLPVYYGWFLNEVDSEVISLVGRSWLQKALGVKEFEQEFVQSFQVSSPEDLHSSFTWNSLIDGGSILHATSKFTARGKGEGAQEYITSPLVKESVGKCFRLCIIGFVITPRTIGARLKLSDEQLELWSSNDNEDPKVIKGTTPNPSDSEPNISKNISVCGSTVTTVKSSSTEIFHPTSGKGSRAHLTLACAPNITPVNTGFDIIRAVRCEQYALRCDDQKPENYTIDEGILRNYGDGVWVLYPQCEVLVSSLFSAFY